jgi:hypothetical protein
LLQKSLFCAYIKRPIQILFMNHIKSAAKAIESELIDIRHHIHSHPELSFEEYKTAELVENYLNSLGIPNKRMAKTGDNWASCGRISTLNVPLPSFQRMTLSSIVTFCLILISSSSFVNVISVPPPKSIPSPSHLPLRLGRAVLLQAVRYRIGTGTRPCQIRSDKSTMCVACMFGHGLKNLVFSYCALLFSVF